MKQIGRVVFQQSVQNPFEKNTNYINLSVNSALVRLSLLGRFVFLLLGVKDLAILFGSLLSLDPE